MFEYSHGNGYKEYCTTRQFFNRYIVDKENLNLKIWEDKVEDKKMERLQWCNIKGDGTKAQLLELRENAILQFDKINEIIDKLNEMEKE
jgi:hypothetical protein